MKVSYESITCKLCGSHHIVKDGVIKGVQRFECRDCSHKFMDNDALPGMRTPSNQIASSLNMYYSGMSLNSIRRQLEQDHQNYPSDSTVYEWIEKYTEELVKESENYHPKVGDTWVADETYIRVDKSKANVKNPYDRSRSAKWVVFWDIIDADTRFLLASHATTTRSKTDAQVLMEKAAKRAGKTPKKVITDQLGSYLDGIEMAYGADTKHVQSKPFQVENNTNLIERFHGTLKGLVKCFV